MLRSVDSDINFNQKVCMRYGSIKMSIMIFLLRSKTTMTYSAKAVSFDFKNYVFIVYSFYKKGCIQVHERGKILVAIDLGEHG